MNSSALGYFIVFFLQISLFCSSYLLILQYRLLTIENFSKCSKDTLAHLILVEKMNQIKIEKKKVDDLDCWIDGYHFEIICDDNGIIGELSGDYIDSIYFEVEFEEEMDREETE